MLSKDQILKSRPLQIKKKPIFDQDQYRKDFYELVLTINPLFKKIPEMISKKFEEMKNSLVQQTESMGTSKKIEDFQTSWKRNIANRFEQEVKGLSNTILLHKKEAKSVKESIEAILSEIDNTISLLNKDESGVVLNDIFEINKRDLKAEFLENLALLDYTLDFADDELRRFFEIDELTCLEICCSDEKETETKKPLQTAVFFDDQLYEQKRAELIECAFKKIKFKGHRALNQVSEQDLDGKLKEVMNSCTEKIKGKAVTDLLKREHAMKAKILTSTASRVQADNIYHAFEKKIEELYIQKAPQESIILGSKLNWEVETKEWERQKKFEQIKKFTNQQTNAYMSVQSITDYECYLNTFIFEKFQPILGESKFDQIVKLLIASLQKDFEGNLIGKKSMKDVLSKEYVLLKTWTYTDLNSRIHKIIELITSEELVSKQFHVKVRFISTPIENYFPDDKSNKNTLYVCNIQNGVTVRRFPSKEINKKIIISEYPHTAGHLTTIQLKESKNFNSLLGDLKFYIQGYSNQSYTDDFLAKLKAYLAILAYEDNTEKDNQLDLHHKDLLKLIKDEPLKQKEPDSMNSSALNNPNFQMVQSVIMKISPKDSSVQEEKQKIPMNESAVLFHSKSLSEETKKSY